MMRNGARCFSIPPCMILRKHRIARGCVWMTDEQAEVLAPFVEIDEVGSVRIALHELVVPGVGCNQLVEKRHEQRAVGAGLDRYPFVGNGGVTGAYGIDRDKASARTLELRDGDLQRIRMMIFRRADHEEQLGAVEIGTAELPERSADRVDHAGRHVRRTKTAVSRIVRRTELFGEEPCQRLHLIAAGKEREFLWVRSANSGKALFEDIEGDFPRHRFELRAATLGVRPAHQWLREASGRILLHDAGRALRADHALVERVLRVAIDVTHFAFAQMHANATATSTHVAGSRLDLKPLVLLAGVMFHAGPPSRLSVCPSGTDPILTILIAAGRQGKSRFARGTIRYADGFNLPSIARSTCREHQPLPVPTLRQDVLSGNQEAGHRRP